MGENTWFDAGHSAGTVAQAFLFLALAVLVRGAFPQTFLTLENVINFINIMLLSHIQNCSQILIF